MQTCSQLIQTCIYSIHKCIYIISLYSQRLQNQLKNGLTEYKEGLQKTLQKSDLHRLARSPTESELVHSCPRGLARTCGAV